NISCTNPVPGPLSFAARSGCATRRARPAKLAGTSRSRVYPHGGTDRFAPVGNDRTEARGCRVWNRISCPGDRQGPQGTVHTVGEAHRFGAESLAARTAKR